MSLQAWTGPKGSRRLKLPKFLDIRHMKVTTLSALRTGRLYFQEISLLTIWRLMATIWVVPQR